MKAELPEQMMRSFYRNTERIAPGTQILSTAMRVQPYEQPFTDYEADYRYFTRLYPSEMREAIPAVHAKCNDLEYKGSLMFDRYPDKEALLLIAAQISEETGASVDGIMMMLLHEILMRRERYRNTLDRKNEFGTARM